MQKWNGQFPQRRRWKYKAKGYGIIRVKRSKSGKRFRLTFETENGSRAETQFTRIEPVVEIVNNWLREVRRQ